MQGYEIHYATNFLGHFALTQHLLPSLLEQRARVVVVSSMLHSFADDAGPDFRCELGIVVLLALFVLQTLVFLGSFLFQFVVPVLPCLCVTWLTAHRAEATDEVHAIKQHHYCICKSAVSALEGCCRNELAADQPLQSCVFCGDCHHVAPQIPARRWACIICCMMPQLLSHSAFLISIFHGKLSLCKI